MSRPTVARRVGLLFGGRSPEHRVSLISARGVAPALEASGLECIPLAATVTGRWLAPEVSRVVLESDAVTVEPVEDPRAHLVVEPGYGLSSVHDDGTTRRVELDVIFPLIHGWGGEDGRLQGCLDLADVRFVGAGVLGSALAMDKEVAKRLLSAAGLPVVEPWRALRAHEVAELGAEGKRRLVEAVGLPLFVKPANAGSSVGISRVTDAAGLDGALAAALEIDTKVVVERGVDAHEIECAVLGNERPEASILGEILPTREFYDYVAKYEDPTSRLEIPAPLDDSTAEGIRSLALDAYRTLEIRGFARVDLLVERGGGRALLNEINTLPGFTPVSMFPKLWEASGLTFPALVSRLVELALEGARPGA